MVKIVYGAKGSGKTKRIIDMANESIESAAGNIVFITDTNRYMFDVKYQIRALNVTEHKIFDEEALIGFIKGLIAGNHDISLIYIDGAHRIAKRTFPKCSLSTTHWKKFPKIRRSISSYA